MLLMQRVGGEAQRIGGEARRYSTSFLLPKSILTLLLSMHKYT
jgi:hypothetical protein